MNCLVFLFAVACNQPAYGAVKPEQPVVRTQPVQDQHADRRDPTAYPWNPANCIRQFPQCANGN